jgi:hypothetical protein
MPPPVAIIPKSFPLKRIFLRPVGGSSRMAAAWVLWAAQVQKHGGAVERAEGVPGR